VWPVEESKILEGKQADHKFVRTWEREGPEREQKNENRLWVFDSLCTFVPLFSA
jgi:hypothetical protein